MTPKKALLILLILIIILSVIFAFLLYDKRVTESNELKMLESERELEMLIRESNASIPINDKSDLQTTITEEKNEDLEIKKEAKRQELIQKALDEDYVIPLSQSKIYTASGTTYQELTPEERRSKRQEAINLLLQSQ